MFYECHVVFHPYAMVKVDNCFLNKLNLHFLEFPAIFVYRMGRLCGSAHEISGIKAQLFLHGWVVWGFLGWVVVVGWVPMTPPIMGGVRCPHVIFWQFGKKSLTKLLKITWGHHVGGIRHPCDTPMLFFGNLVKKLDNLITVNQLQTLMSIHLYWKYVLIIC